MVDIKEMILILLDCDELSPWEYDFINSVADEEYLSNNQERKVEQIYKQYIED